MASLEQSFPHPIPPPAERKLAPSLRIMRSGARIDITDPDPAQLHLRDIAEHLAVLPNDPAEGSFYTMAQHSVLFADTVARSLGALPALYALLHAAPIAVIGAVHPRAADLSYLGAHRRLSERIHHAAGLFWPAPAIAAGELELWHRRLELTELKLLRRGVGADIAILEAAGHTPLRGGFTTWPWHQAADKFEAAWRKFSAAASLAPLPTWCAP